MVRIGPAEVRARYSVDPARVPDFIALRGDPSDKLPGAPAGAAALLRQYGSLDAILKAGPFPQQAENSRPFWSIATCGKLPMLLPGITASTGAGDFAPIKQILGLAGDGANMVEASRIDEERNALAHGQPAALMLALDLVAPRARSLRGASAHRVQASSLCTPPGAAPLFDCSWFAPQAAPARVGERKGNDGGNEDQDRDGGPRQRAAVAVGAVVKAGDDIAIVEAMKMEIPVSSPASGTVKALLVAVDEMVEEARALSIIENLTAHMTRERSLEGGVEAAYRAEIDAAADPKAKLAEIEERLNKLRSRFRSAERFWVEEIIDRGGLARLAEPLRRTGVASFQIRPQSAYTARGAACAAYISGFALLLNSYDRLR